MTRWLLVFGLIAAGGGGLAWLLVERAPGRRPDADPGVEHAPAPGAAPAAPALRVEGGVAHAPDFQADPPGDATKSPPEKDHAGAAHLFVGRAVFAGTDEPVAGAAVVLERVGGADAWAQPETDARGRFRAHRPAGASGALRVVVRGPRGAAGVVPAQAGPNPPSPVTDLGVVRVGGAEVLSGFVYAASGAPAAGRDVRAFRFAADRLLDGAVARATSDERGWFEMEDLPLGVYLLRSTGDEGRRHLRFPVVVPRADPIELRPMESARLALVVRDSAGRPSGAAKVEAWPVRPPGEFPLDRAHYLQPWFAETDARGRAELPFLPLARWTLRVTLVDGAPFEFAHDHRRRAERTLRVATRTPLTFAFLKAKPPRRPVPLPNTKLRLEFEGRNAVAHYDASRSLTITTDAQALFTLPRIGARAQVVRAVWAGENREGVSTIDLRETLETARPHPVILLPRPPGAPPLPGAPALRTNPPPRERRTVTVRTPEGLPVKGAFVYAEGDERARVATDAEGIAVVQPRAGGRVFLYRPDLASGDPATDGDALVWRAGRPVAVEVRDGDGGFPLPGARVGPRPRAWRRTGPATFATRWGVSDEPLTATARGYGTWRAPVPPEGGALVAELHPPPEPPAATLLVEVVRDNRPAPAAVVRGTWDSGNEEGRAAFTALTGPAGRALVRDLREGVWTIAGATADGASGRTQPRLARGLNPVALPLDLNRALEGVVRDRERRPVAGAAVRAHDPGAKGSVARTYTGADGTFVLRVAAPERPLAVTVRAPGFAPASRTVAPRALDRTVSFRLFETAALDLPVRWEDGGRDPLPDDTTIEVRVRPRRRRPWKLLGRYPVRDGRLAVPGVPPGRVRWSGTLVRPGAAWVGPGRTRTSPTVLVRRGGVVRGRVVRDRKGVPHETVHLVGRTTTAAAVTDGHGAFEFARVPPGAYALVHPYQHPDSARANRRVNVAPGAPEELLVELLHYDRTR